MTDGTNFRSSVASGDIQNAGFMPARKTWTTPKVILSVVEEKTEGAPVGTPDAAVSS
jgi:hypothetical protein